MNSPIKVYLAGYISGEHIKQCIEWRRKICDYFYKNPKWHNQICFLDPLCGKNLESISLDGNKSNISSRAFMLRDYYGVKNADFLIVNLSIFDGKRPLIGTIFELAWAWQDHKPVIAIGIDKNYIEHPFIQETVVAIVPIVEDLLESELIKYYFKGTVSACD